MSGSTKSCLARGAWSQGLAAPRRFVRRAHLRRQYLPHYRSRRYRRLSNQRAPTLPKEASRTKHVRHRRIH